MQIQKLSTPLPTMGSQTDNDCAQIRAELVKLAVTEGIRVAFDTPKRSIGSYLAYVARPLAPRKFSHRVLDKGTPKEGCVIGIWRTK